MRLLLAVYLLTIVTGLVLFITIGLMAR